MTSRGSWLRLLPAISGYIFVAFQLFVVTKIAKNTYDFILNLLNIAPCVKDVCAADTNIPFLLTIIYFPIYTLVVALFVYGLEEIIDKISLRLRLAKFDTAIGRITRYHEGKLVSKTKALTLTNQPVGKPVASSVSQVLLDLLITDVRDAFEALCRAPDIRVSVYVRTRIEGATIGVIQPAYNEDSAADSVLKMVATTEFDKDYELSTVFGRLNTSAKFQGLCGEAWNTKEAVSGNGRDKRYFNYNILDRTRSFLCLPVKSMYNGNEYMVAVLSIDSSRSIDLNYSRQMRETMMIKTTSIRRILNEYLNYTNFLAMHPFLEWSNSEQEEQQERREAKINRKSRNRKGG